jgi:uncharacterized protein (TIGR02680 family)
MSQGRWQPFRAGFLNYWYLYDDVFYFQDGKLMLHGHNAAGKSVGMNSLIPVLLDGNKSPERLDPFATRSRKMDELLLGEQDQDNQRSERTAYLFLEYKRKNSEQYFTTGMGVRAKRGGRMDSWYFIITDNRRITDDLFLYHRVQVEGEEQKIPLTRQELERAIGNGGEVFLQANAYAEKINDYLFQFPNMEAFEELIKLLIQLRTPKLSKDYKPSVTYEILNQSIPALTDEELRPLSDIIESMDQLHQRLDQMKRDVASLEKLCVVYGQYNQYVLGEKAEQLLRIQKNKLRLEGEHDQLETDLAKEFNSIKENEQRIVHLKEEKIRLEQTRDSLENQEVLEMMKENEILTNRFQDNQTQIDMRSKAHEEKFRKDQSFKQNVDQAEHSILHTKKDIMDLLADLEGYADDCDFRSHQELKSQFEKQVGEKYSFIPWKEEIQSHHHQINEAMKVLSEHEKLNEHIEQVQGDLGIYGLKINKEEENFDWLKRQIELKKEVYLKQFHIWKDQQDLLALTSEQIHAISRYIQHLYSGYEFQDIQNVLQECYEQHQIGWLKKAANLEAEIARVKETIQKKEWEKERLKKRELEPQRASETEESRIELIKKGIPFVPFYLAVEFHSDVKEDQRSRIEDALLQMGILDALVIPSNLEIKEIQYQGVLRGKKKVKGASLADYLVPRLPEGSKVSIRDVEEVLQSIAVGTEHETAVKDDGTYQIGLLHGHAPNYDQSFIGEDRRNEYRLRLVQSLEMEIHELARESSTLEGEKGMFEQNIQQLQDVRLTFPIDSELKLIVEKYKQAELYLNIYREMEFEKNKMLKELLIRRQQLGIRIQQLTKDISLSPTTQAFENAKKAVLQYLNILTDLEHKQERVRQHRAAIVQWADLREDLQVEMDQLKYEVLAFEAKNNHLTEQIKELTRIIDEKGGEDLRLRIEEITNRLQEIPGLHEELILKVDRSKNRIDQMKQRLKEKESECLLMKEVYQTWKQVFVQEDRLGFTSVKDYDPANEEELLQRATELLEETRALQVRYKAREQIKEELDTVFRQEQSQLIDYRLTEKLVAGEELPNTSLSNYIYHIDYLRKTAGRSLIMLDYRGKTINPLDAKRQIEELIVMDQSALDEKDRALFEEIIYNNIGDIIRHRIERAEKWVSKMNDLIVSRKNSLQMSIHWKPKVSIEQDQLDTKVLLELLRMDPLLMKLEDVERITRHFKSKIDSAKERFDSGDYKETLHQIIKNVLDFREWFSFKLNFKKAEHRTEQELTNVRFGKLSGGEKALAMYLPLFAAVYSRYEESGEDGVRLITLDECFAGVDEKNIRDTFELLADLEFDFIMNSQIIWGDYDTVTALSIYDFIRPNDADFVTLIRYTWDGRVRRRIDDLNLDEQGFSA